MNQLRKKILDHWALPVVSLELRKIFSYRFDFWLNFFVSVVMTLTIAYYLWGSVFASVQQTQIGNRSFENMMFYYLLAPLAAKMINGQRFGRIFTEIYSGELNRYLLYPLDFFYYKMVTHFSQAIFFCTQFILGLFLYNVFFSFPPDNLMTFESVCLGLFTCLLSGQLFFVVSTCLELVAFWADNVWSLLVMLRMLIGVLGGAFLPLSLYSDKTQELLALLPFQYLLSFPVRTLMGEIGLQEWLRGVSILLLWGVFFYLIMQKIWQRGMLKYNGVGI